MPHDKNGVEIKKGDRVRVEFIVNEVNTSEENCNALLEAAEPMQSGYKPYAWFNTGQCEKISSESVDTGGQ